MLDLTDFLEPVDLHRINEDLAITDGQLAKNMLIFSEEFPDLEDSDIIIAGIQESRGGHDPHGYAGAADNIRKHLYRLHYWHEDVKIADIGNIRAGETVKDSYAAIRTVMMELVNQGKTIVLIGGSHDITLAQYQAYRDLDKLIDATCVDATVDLRGESPIRCENFLLDMLTEEPNLVRHYNHIAFQSYFVHPRMLDTLDRLRFDCFRLGRVRENIEEMEPVLRGSDMLSFDMSAVRHADAPANVESPNGLTGEEACTLTRFAGMSHRISSIGIYGYNPDLDRQELTARQIAQMIWYFVDGRQIAKGEGSIKDRDNFYEFHSTFGEMETVFLQNKKTRRWWMQLPDKRFIPCSHNDYLQASINEIPERWLKAQEIN
jgi:arginase family enzyme